MKSTVEKLSPTRVRINVEVPFTELQPDFDRAYKELAKQVRLPGFRPGKAPAKLLEARIGRDAVLDQVVNDALPGRYTEAVTSSEVQPSASPRSRSPRSRRRGPRRSPPRSTSGPRSTLPDLEALKITVDPIEVDRRGRRRRAAESARPLRHAHRCRARGRERRLRLHRPVGHRRRRGRTRGHDRGAVARGRLRSADRGSRRGRRRPQGGGDPRLHHHPGRR